MRIGVDVLGGDFAPDSTVLGSILAFKEINSDVRLVLIGDESRIKEICKREKFDSSVFDIVHSTEFIGMGEHPAKAYAQKPKSTIALGFKMLASGEIDGFASAGSTGAMLVGSMYTGKVVPGVIRPTIAVSAPNAGINPTVILDAGINPDAKQDVLFQYAILGSLYSQYVYEVKNPRVALLNIGSEEEKGNLVVKATYQLLKDSKDVNFVGNIEGNELFHIDKADVVVCDGFVGNTVIKEAEAFYHLVKKRNINDEYFEKFNFENHGGTPILGVDQVAIIGHGNSQEKAIRTMILHTIHVAKAELTNKIKEAFKKWQKYEQLLQE